jgi:Mg-chelatase subunit ChlD
MTFQHLEWVYVAVPLLIIAVVVRFWRRHYWGHSLVEQLGWELGGPNPILRLPTLLEGAAVGFLLIALLGPVYPFVLNRIERGGLQIMFVFDLSQSMEEPLGKGAPANVVNGAIQINGGAPKPNQSPKGATPKSNSKMDAVKASAVEFIKERPGDAIGLVVFSNNAYLVSPATFDHDSLLEYLKMVNVQTLVNEGFTAIGEGLGVAEDFFAFSRERGQRSKGQVIVLFSDGDNNYGRDPMKEIEKARQNGTRVYFIGVALEPGASQQIAENVDTTGGKFFDVREPNHLKAAMADINQAEKGRFYTLQLTRQQPAYFIFVLLAFAALFVRMLLNGIPHFVELS